MARTPLIAGNWKMNLDHLEAIKNIQKLTFALPKEYYEKVNIAVLAPFTDLRSIQTVVNGEKMRISYGAQNVAAQEKGAYTGDVSAPMLAKLGCTWVIIGHSERRHYHHETSELVSHKAQIAHQHGIKPIVCVGESLDIRESGSYLDYIVDQARQSLEGLNAQQLKDTVLAYEPVWAIGTGKAASPQDAQEVCKALRELIARLADEETADAVRILYGGSVRTDSIAEIVAQPDVDGGLVGGASLDGEEFAKLAAASVAQI
ncbi:triose-phosphate isomerase [Corynebacterium sp. MNWGS58]|uniref:triose-phosphate isomerase n=1 Tax=Corynebacterium sp. 102791.4 TaxID=3104612 RepID=UPI003516797F